MAAASIGEILVNLLSSAKSVTEWESDKKVLPIGYIAVSIDGGAASIKLGDGLHTWEELPFFKGEQGLKGDKGDTGAKGEQGIQGLKGDKGDTGAAGLLTSVNANSVIGNNTASAATPINLTRQQLTNLLYSEGMDRSGQAASGLYTYAFSSNGVNPGYLSLQKLRERMGLGDTLSSIYASDTETREGILTTKAVTPTGLKEHSGWEYYASDNYTTKTYIRLFSVPVSSNGNYSRVTLSGNMGGWNVNTSGDIHLTVSNRDANQFACMLIGSIQTSTTNIIFYQEDSGILVCYLVVSGYAIAKLNVDGIQYTPYGTSSTAVPNGTLIWQMSAAANVVKIDNSGHITAEGFSGNATTQVISDNSTKLATTAFIKNQGYVTESVVINTSKSILSTQSIAAMVNLG